jgi:predicted DNA-binding transcriptional regulator YafY
LDSWLGEKTYKIKLLLMKPWFNRRKIPLLIENQTITKNPDRSMLLEAEVNSLVELSQWVVAQGRGVKVLEPFELQRLVLNTVKATLTNYQ